MNMRHYYPSYSDLLLQILAPTKVSQCVLHSFGCFVETIYTRLQDNDKFWSLLYVQSIAAKKVAEAFKQLLSDPRASKLKTPAAERRKSSALVEKRRSSFASPVGTVLLVPSPSKSSNGSGFDCTNLSATTATPSTSDTEKPFTPLSATTPPQTSSASDMSPTSDMSSISDTPKNKARGGGLDLAQAPVELPPEDSEKPLSAEKKKAVQARRNLKLV